MDLSEKKTSLQERAKREEKTLQVFVGLFLLSLLLTIPRWTVKHPHHEEAEAMLAEVERLRAENEIASGRNVMLWREVEALSNDPRAQARQVRDTLHYVRSDELVFVFPRGVNESTR